MSQQSVKGEEAIQRMAKRALNQPSSSKAEGQDGDPLKEAQQFTKQMAANAIIASEVAKAEAAKEEAEARAAKARAEARKAETGEEKKPPFDMSGSIKLGDIDYGAMVKKAEIERDELRKQAEESVRAQGQANDELREKVHEKEMELLKVTFQAQLDTITRALEGRASQKTLLEQLSDLRETAKAIGLAEPKSAGDAMVQVELKKLEFDHDMALRRMSREDKMSDREFQLKLRELDDKRDRDKQDLLMQQKNQDFWRGAPAAIGQALYQGIKESQRSGISEEAPEEPRKRGKGHHIEIGKGESGAVDCPECGSEIQVGPTASRGVCAGCGLSVAVKRVAAESEESESGFKPTY